MTKNNNTSATVTITGTDTGISYQLIKETSKIINIFSVGISQPTRNGSMLRVELNTKLFKLKKIKKFIKKIFKLTLAVLTLINFILQFVNF